MMPVKWSEDGFPYMTQGDDLVPMIVKREGVKRDTTVTYGNFELIENFDSPVLDMPWMTLELLLPIYIIDGNARISDFEVCRY